VHFGEKVGTSSTRPEDVAVLDAARARNEELEASPGEFPVIPEMDAAVTASEIRKFSMKVRIGTGTGLDGTPARLVRLLLKCELSCRVLAVLFTLLLSRACSVREWLCSLVSPMAKKGVPPGSTDLDGFRGLNLLPILRNLYARVLDARIRSVYRMPAAQRAFQHGCSPVEHPLTLHLLVERLRELGRTLWVCFVDLRKAFPSVERELLWRALAERGVTWQCWKALRALYSGTLACARGNGGFSQPFSISRGVLEGDTLGPLLWAIFFSSCAEEVASVAREQGWEELAAAWSESAPLDSAWALWCLLFADDTALVAPNAAVLQQIIDIFERFCVRNLLTINMKKTVGVVFRSLQDGTIDLVEREGGGTIWQRGSAEEGALSQPVDVRMNGEPVCFAREFVYVGSLLHETRGLIATAERAVGEGRKALNAFMAGVQLTPSLPLRHLLEVGRSLIMGTVLVNAPLWGASAEGRELVADLQAEFLRRVCGARKDSTLESLLAVTRSPAWSWQTAALVVRFVARPMRMGILVQRTVAAARDRRTQRPGEWSHGVRELRRRYVTTAMAAGIRGQDLAVERLSATTRAINNAEIKARLARDVDRPFARVLVVSRASEREMEGVGAILHACDAPTARVTVARFFLGLEGAARVHGHWWLRKGQGPLPQRQADVLFGQEPRTEVAKRACLHCRVRDLVVNRGAQPVLESEEHVLLFCSRERSRRSRVGLPAASSLPELLCLAAQSRNVASSVARFLVGALPERARIIERKCKAVSR